MIVTCSLPHTRQETALRQIRDFATRIPVLRSLGFRLTDVQRGFVVFEGQVTEGLTQNGILHGGILAAILDTACAAAAISVDFPDSYATTQGFKSATCDQSNRVRFAPSVSASGVARICCFLKLPCATAPANFSPPRRRSSFASRPLSFSTHQHRPTANKWRNDYANTGNLCSR